jgi:hypothetical protein
MMKRKLNNKQMRWAKELVAFNFVLEYRIRSNNLADSPLRRPDFKRKVVEDTWLLTLHNKLKYTE